MNWRVAGRKSSLALVWVVITGCFRPGLSKLDGDTGATGTDGSSNDDSDGGSTGDAPVVSQADILMIIDNSGSMAEEQDLVATGAVFLVRALEQSKIDYRIGITTTDEGNPWCVDTTPELGSLVLSSCLGRLDDFVFEGAELIDAKHVCTDNCTLDSMSTTDGKPWIERINGTTNLSNGVTIEQAFACAIPQGITGCGFESPLGAMKKSLDLSEVVEGAESGFIRNEGVLAVIFVTDELDCSDNSAYESIFLQDGMRTFWSDPEAGQPTSAVCWNAGVACTGGAEGSYDECHSVNKDIAGVPGVPGDEAVLRPVTRFVDRARKIESGGKRVVVGAIAGVPKGYATGGAELEYVDAQDPGFAEAFGIGPGCESTMGEAVPPVRLREFAEAFETGAERNLYSVCNPTYSSVFTSIASQIIAHTRE